MRSRTDTSTTRAKLGERPTSSMPAGPDHGANSATTIVEPPQKPRGPGLDAREFPDGGGSGGAEAFSRRRIRSKR